MSRTLSCLPWALLVGVQLLAQAPAIEPVLQAERAFARLAEEKGIRRAFLAWLTEDARVFTPRMVLAKAQYGPEPGDPGHLVWVPEAMGIAASGDLAWSFGPWTYAVKQGEAVLVHGHFLSVWQKVEGRWKVVADIGVPHAAPLRPTEPFVAGGTSASAWNSTAKIADATPVLRKLETQLSAAWGEKGGLALVPELAKEARVLRPRLLPLHQEGEIRKALEADRPGPTWEPAHIQVAASGDLGWTCGETGPDEQGAAASFLRIWILQAGAWKVLFDVRLPLPAAPK